MRMLISTALIVCGLVVCGLMLGGCVIVVDHEDHWHDADDRSESPFIGVHLAGVSEATASQAGVSAPRACLIAGITAGSPAERAGLQRFDVVTGIDGRDYASESALREAIRGRKAGEEIKLTVVRGGKVQEIAVVVGER